MDKRGISPLLSTVILIFLAIGVGVILMNWGRAQLEANAKCAVDTELDFVFLNGDPQVCFDGSGSNGFVKFIVENGVNIDVSSLSVRIIGSEQVYESVLDKSFIEVGSSLQKVVPYDFDVFGKIRQVRITPRIQVYPKEPSLICPEQSLIIESISEC